MQISLLLFCFAMPLNAQRSIPITDTIGRIEHRLKEYIKEIETLDEAIKDYDDINKYNPSIEYRIDKTEGDCDYYYRTNQDIIDYYDNLKTLVEQFRTRQNKLKNRISTIRQNYFRNELQSQLDCRLNEMHDDWELVQQYVQAKRGKTDSLTKVQQRCKNRYDETRQLPNNYDSRIATDEEIKSTLDSISALNEKIQAAQIKEVKIGDILFKVALIVAALSTTIALISSRIRSAKLLKQNLQDYSQGKKLKKHKNSDSIEL